MSKEYTFLLPEGEFAVPVKEDGQTLRKNKATPTSRRFCLVSYIEPDALLKFLQSRTWIQHWAMITHDNDVLEDGSPKEKHTHVLLYTFSHKSSSAIKKNFDRFSAEYYRGKGEAQNTLVQICSDMVKQWRYLIHVDDLDKFQYDQSERLCDSIDYWVKYEGSDGLNDSQNNVGLAMLNDLLNGATTMQMCERYGKEYIYHKAHFESVKQSHISEEYWRARGYVQSQYSVIDDIMKRLMISPFSKSQQEMFASMLEYVVTELAKDSGVILAIDTQNSEIIERM